MSWVRDTRREQGLPERLTPEQAAEIAALLRLNTPTTDTPAGDPPDTNNPPLEVAS